MSEASSGNAFDETEENCFDQQNIVEEENNFISNNYFLLGAGKEKIRVKKNHVYHPAIHFRRLK